MLDSLRRSGRKIKLLLSLGHQLSPLVKATSAALVLRGFLFGIKSGNETFVVPHKAAMGNCFASFFWWDMVGFPGEFNYSMGMIFTLFINTLEVSISNEIII